MYFISAIHSQVAILVDDMIDSGKTLAMATQSLKEHGAKQVFALISHGLSSSVTIFWFIGVSQYISDSQDYSPKLK